MEKLQVLVVDNDEKILSELNKNNLVDNDIFEIVATTSDGREALAMVQTLNPDVIVLELLVPYLDGFAILEAIQNDTTLAKKPTILVTSTMASDIIVKEVFQLGADYFMVKPYDTSILRKRIERIYREKHTDNTVELSINIDAIIEHHLSGLGMPASLKGYRYIVSAVKEVINEPNMIYGVTKILYPEVAKKHQSTAIRVEKSIRHAIEVAWSRIDNMSRIEMLGEHSRDRKRPTNSEFIALMAQKVRPVA